MSHQYFHFSLGPVQAFVAQARRTRDFWAGSFLLSYLSAVAMRSVQNQVGNDAIVFPEMDEKLMTALDTGQGGPNQGTVPNRFMARVGVGFDPRRVAGDLQCVWRALADRVWCQDLAVVCNHHPQTRAIWDRQIAAFWDIQWLLTENESDANGLDRLKNWRTHLPPPEPGVKCMMMDGWQELSGAKRSGEPVLHEFWRTVRASKGDFKTDLRDGEALCAMALIKRRFARHFEGFFCDAGGWTAKGWRLPTAQPSTYYLAAAHWIAQAVRCVDVDDESELRKFRDTVHDLGVVQGEHRNALSCIEQVVTGRSKDVESFATLDGNAFFSESLDERFRADFKDSGAETLAKAKDTLNQAKSTLSCLRQTVRERAPGVGIRPFYALLLMDGDELGKHMKGDKRGQISTALSRFTREAVQIVKEYSGFLVYAGGDDVFALLPVKDALKCAVVLRCCYLECFAGTGIDTTLSGAVTFAHVKLPLGKLIEDTHDLLDTVAKDGCGRDALACRVYKPGGLAVEWAMPWVCALRDGRLEIERIAEQWQGSRGANESANLASKTSTQADDPLVFANRFFHRLRRHFEVLGHDLELLKQVLAMELRQSGLVDPGQISFEQAVAQVEPLIKQSCRCIRDKSKSPEQWSTCPPNDQAAMLVRFLANRGVE